MLTNDRNLITKRENDWAKRNAKPLNEKEQDPCELLVQRVHTQIEVTNLVLNIKTGLNVVTCLLSIMKMTKTVDEKTLRLSLT